MASYPPQSCCYQGFKGQPQGSLSMVDDFKVYTSHPLTRSTEIRILMQLLNKYSLRGSPCLTFSKLTDINGHRVPNAQLIADQFAMNGHCYYTRSVLQWCCAFERAGGIRYAEVEKRGISCRRKEPSPLDYWSNNWILPEGDERTTIPRCVCSGSPSCLSSLYYTIGAYSSRGRNLHF